jgi:hypothetical protein
MNTKFDNFISEMMGSEGSSEIETSETDVKETSETDVIRSIRQDLTKCGSKLENLKYQFSEQRDHNKAAKVMDALISVDNARKILFNLQD